MDSRVGIHLVQSMRALPWDQGRVTPRGGTAGPHIAAAALLAGSDGFFLADSVPHEA